MLKITVPATSANLGPGFDCLGVALNIFNTFIIEEIDTGLIIEGCSEEFCNKDNLVYSSMISFFNLQNYTPKGIKIVINSDIPVCSGLGSSSTCILAGILAADNICSSRLSKSEILNIAAKIEGHCDNLVPALVGGLTASTFIDKVYYQKFSIDEGLRFYSLTPDYCLSTKTSRSVLPKNILFKDAVSNIANSTLVLASLIKNDFNMLKDICIDNIHEKYRAPLIPDFNDIKSKASEFGAIFSYLSGAGPTIMCIAESSNVSFKDKMKEYIDKLDTLWMIRELKVCNFGASIAEY